MSRFFILFSFFFIALAVAASLTDVLGSVFKETFNVMQPKPLNEERKE